MYPDGYGCIYIFLNISMNRSPYPLHVDLVIHKDIYLYLSIDIDRYRYLRV